VNEIIESVGNLTSVTTVRRTYKLQGSDDNKDPKASTYLSAAKAISKKAYIFAEVIDCAHEFCFSVAVQDMHQRMHLFGLV
jgi:hypothetical protein